MGIRLFLGTGPCRAAAVGSTLAVVGAAASLLRTRSCWAVTVSTALASLASHGEEVA